MIEPGWVCHHRRALHYGGLFQVNANNSTITRIKAANQSPLETSVNLLRETHDILRLNDFIPDPRPLKLRVETERFLRGFSNPPEAA